MTRQTDAFAELFTDIAKYHPDAVRRLLEAQPGYPSGHDGTGGGSTQPERYERTLGDDAVKDLEKLRQAEKVVGRAGLDIWGIVTKWGTARDAHDLQVADPEDELWCRSCLRVGRCEPRRKQGGVNCGWCATTLRELNKARGTVGKRALTELPRRAVQVHAEGRRISQRDLLRWAGIPDAQHHLIPTVLADVVSQKVGFRQPETHAPVNLPGASFMRTTVTCGVCGETLPVPDGDTGQTVLDAHHTEGCAA